MSSSKGRVYLFKKKKKIISSHLQNLLFPLCFKTKKKKIKIKLMNLH